MMLCLYIKPVSGDGGWVAIPDWCAVGIDFNDTGELGVSGNKHNGSLFFLSRHLIDLHNKFPLIEVWKAVS